jgi:serine/threonine protein kinase
LDVFGHGKEMNLVLEFVKSDLKQIIENRQYMLDAGDRKSIMLQALQGLEYLHSNWILHRVCRASVPKRWDGRLPW